MEGKARALEAYNISRAPRKFVEYCCCMFSVFKKRKIDKSNYLYIEEAVEPDGIIWENIGRFTRQRIYIWAVNIIVAMLFLGLTLFVMLEFASIEK